MADIYTLFNYLEKRNAYLYNNDLSKKILTCLYPILPKLTRSLNKILFKSNKFENWPNINLELLVVEKINYLFKFKVNWLQQLTQKKDILKKI